MKTKMKSILLSILAVAAFCSCSKDEANNDISSGEQSVSLTLNLGKLNMTKGVAETSTSSVAIVGEDEITIKAYASESKANEDKTGTASLKTIELSLQQLSDEENKDFSLSGGNIYTSKAGKIILPTSATWIVVSANDDGAQRMLNENGVTDDPDGSVKLSSEINTRQGSIRTRNVRVVGGAKVDGDAAAGFTCNVTLTPDMARIEVMGIMKAAQSPNNVQSTSIKLTAIYINNTLMDRNDSPELSADKYSRTGSSSTGWTVSPFTAGGSKKLLFDKFTGFPDGGIKPGKGFDNGSAETTHATGYNIFPQKGEVAATPDATPAFTANQNASKFSPHMIFEFERLKVRTSANDVLPVTWSTAKTLYLNVIAFNDVNGDLIAAFEAGNVYQFDLSELYSILNDTYPSPVTDSPDPATAGVTLTVEVGSWKLVVVKPVV